MTGAMYAAIGGLKSHMQKLNVIGNNIANVNTYGYKAGRTVFETSLYTSINTGSNGTEDVGGRNPSQIGYGVSVGSVDIDMSTGNYSPTGKATDCMIDGDGFFLVGDKTVATSIDGTQPESLKTLTLTRVGNFEFKADGYLTDGSGNVVYGFLATGVAADGKTPIVSDLLVPIRYPRMNTDPAAQDANNNPIEVGAPLYPTQDATTGTVVDNIGAGTTPNPFCQFDTVTIDPETGKISGITENTDQVVTIGFIAIGKVTNPNGVTQMSETYYRALDGAGDMSIAVLGGAADMVTVDQTGADLTQTLQYVNGVENTGDDIPGMRINTGGTVALITGGLEMSKTDLATEISEMITTQRGYQANTRIITVTDSMLEELVNIKR